MGQLTHYRISGGGRIGKQLVIIAAGHAHLTILKNLQEFTKAGHDVTVMKSFQDSGELDGCFADKVDWLIELIGLNLLRF